MTQFSIRRAGQPRGQGSRRPYARRARTAAARAVLDHLEMAVFVVTEKMAVVFMNAASKALLAADEVFTLASGRLRAGSRDADRELRRLVVEAAAGGRRVDGFMAFPRRPHRRPLSARVLPLFSSVNGGSRRQAVVFIADPELGFGDSVDNVASVYGLTGAEVRLVGALVCGDCIKEAAGRLGIAETTARNVLARVMAKTETRRQAELIRLVLTSRAPVL